MRKMSFFSGFFLGVVTMVGCASMTYRYYGLSLPDECYDKGQLLGKLGDGGWPDVSFSTCKPDPTIKGKCVLQLQDDFFKKDQALKECEVALKDCQDQKPPSAFRSEQ